MPILPAWLTIDNIFHPRLSEYFPDWENHGIFQSTAMQAAPWVNDNTHPISPAALDLVYFANRSGEKLPSPMVKKLAENDDDFGLTSTQVERLGAAIMNIYGVNFAKLWETTKAQYNPLENYRMTESETNSEETTHGHTLTVTDNLTHRKTGTTTKTPETTVTENAIHTPGTTVTENTTRTPNLREDTANGVAGFNSSSMSDQSEQTKTETGTESTQSTTATTGTETTRTTTATTGNDTETYNATDTDTGTKTHANSGTDSEEGERTLTRYGNIGVTTSQQMLQAERDLWVWNYIENVVFPAVDEVLTIQTY